MICVIPSLVHSQDERGKNDNGQPVCLLAHQRKGVEGGRVHAPTLESQGHNT